MCGIAGMFVPDREIDRDRFEKMVDLIAYRGPDDRGTFYSISSRISADQLYR